MKHVSVVEVYTTKFSHSLFLLKIEENLMSVEKMYCNGSGKSLTPQLLFEVFYLGFILFLHFSIYLDCYCKECLLKQIASLCLRLSLKSALF